MVFDIQLNCSLLFAFFLGGFIQEFLSADIVTKYLGSRKLRGYFLTAVLGIAVVSYLAVYLPKEWIIQYFTGF